MDWIKKNYNIALLILAVVILLLVGFIIFSKFNSLNEEYQTRQSNQQDNMPAISAQLANSVGENLEKGKKWVRPTVSTADGKTKRPSLFVSTPIVLKDGIVYDLQIPEPKLRPPLDNAWLLEYELEFLRNDVLELDPDSDGFTNIEEYKISTNPEDSSSHPPLHHKLRLANLKSFAYELEFSGINDEVYTIKRRRPNSRSWFVEIGQSFGEDDRFKVINYTKKDRFDSENRINIDVSELQIFDNKTGEEQTLVYKQKLQLPNYEAKFDYLISGSTIEAAKGKTFTLPNDKSNTIYTFESINLETKSVVISFTDQSTGTELKYSVPTK